MNPSPSAPGDREIAELIRPGEGGGLLQIDHGGRGEATSIVCGYLTTAHSPNLLIATLPSILRLDISKRASRDWVEASVRFAGANLSVARSRLCQ